MNSGPLLFLSAFLTLAASFWGLVVAPQLQIGGLDIRELQPSGELYPSGRMGLAKQGANVYRAHGCVECHTQQVRPSGYGGDIDRGWGVRRSVALDYLRDDPVMLGSLRMGPDLANIGSRHPDPQWHLLHLYHPKALAPNSTMPPYRFLFEERAVQGAPSPDALKLEDDLAPMDGREIVPTEEAIALVAYMRSLRAEVGLFEAPLPLPEPEPVDTNAPPPEPAPVINPEDFE